jgi:hypothetical protein
MPYSGMLRRVALAGTEVLRETFMMEDKREFLQEVEVVTFQKTTILQSLP